MPIKVAPKNVEKGIKKWPQVIPARSKSGLGIEAIKNTVTKAYFYKFLYTNNLIFPTNEIYSYYISYISSFYFFAIA